MIAYEITKWVAKSPQGYLRVYSDQRHTLTNTLDQATRFDSERVAKNAALTGALAEIINGRTVPVIVYERITETVHIESVLNAHWDVNERAVRLMLVRDVSRAVAHAYQWIMTNPDIDYREWKCAILLPEWEFTDPDGDTVEERLASINMDAIVSDRTIFLKREEDIAIVRLLFDEILLGVALENGTTLMGWKQA